MKIISPTIHGFLDYATVVFFGMAPTMFDLRGPYATICYVLAVGYLAITLLTNFPMGVLRLIPFPVHGWLEFFSGFAFLASPYLFGFAQNPVPRNLFMGSGVVFLLVWFFTDWRAQTRSVASNQP